MLNILEIDFFIMNINIKCNKQRYVFSRLVLKYLLICGRKAYTYLFMQHIMKHTYIRGQNELVDVCLEVKSNHKKVM